MATLNPHVLDTGSPPVPEAKGWVHAYDGRHGQLIDLSQAAPAVAPPPAMLDRLAAAARDPATAKYGMIEGDSGLREAFAAESSRIYGAAIAPNEIAITPGCNQAFVVTMMAIAKAGDDVILPAPWYFNHAMALQLLGIGNTTLRCLPEAGFVPRVEDARALIGPRTKAIILVTPNNPTGAIYSPDVIAAFAALCREHNIWLVLDETYRDFLPDHAPRPHELFSASEARENLIQLYSFSKSFAIPGYRLGSVIAPAAFQRELKKILDTVQICPARVGQIATTWAIGALRDWREDNRRGINTRAQAFKAAMVNLNDWRVESVGAYFAYLRHPFGNSPAAQVAEKLAKERGVLTLPGPYFGPDQHQHLRVAFANADAQALQALPERLRNFQI